MKVRFERNRTSAVIVMYSLYLYFLGLSLRNTSKALVIFRDVNKRSYVLYGTGIKDLDPVKSTKGKECLPLS